MDGLPVFEPDYYTVMDKLSYDAAIKEGISKDLLVITGHTGYANMRQNSYPEMNINLKNDLDLNNNKKYILFVSEPVSSDQPQNNQENFRGYTEKEVVYILCKSLDKYSDNIQLLIAPHPRDEIKLVNDLFYRNKRSLNIKILEKNNVSSIINNVSGVVGMASVVLYEAWLLGVPTISIQPNLIDNSLRSFNKRNGLIFIDSYLSIDKSIEKFMFKILDGRRFPQIELMKQNRMSIKKVVDLFL